MKKLLLSIAILVSFISCTENNNAITYKTYNSHNKEYIVEIPSYLNLTHSIGDFMDFTKEDSYIITVNTTYAANIYDIVEKPKGYNYSLIQSSDTSLFYKVTQNNTPLFSAVNHFMIKEINGKKYAITLSGAFKSTSESIAIISHIYNSLKPTPNGNVSVDKSNANNGLNKKYNNIFYSISYPSDWQHHENPDAITDVMFSSKNGETGFTIISFDSDLSMNDLIQESHQNLSSIGLKIDSSHKETINGREFHKITINHGNYVKQIQYMVKNIDKFYIISFIYNENNNKSFNTTMGGIMNSFRIK